MATQPLAIRKAGGISVRDTRRVAKDAGISEERLITEVASARGLTKLGLRKIAPTVLISTAPPQATLTALRAAGYTPVLEAETSTTVLERAPQERAEPRMPELAQAHPHYGPGPATAPALAAALLHPEGSRGGRKG